MRKLLLVLSLILLAGCSTEQYSITDETQVNHSLDSLYFKNDYEAYNNDVNEYEEASISLTIDENNPVIYATLDEINEILKEGSGIIFLGSPSNAYARVMAPILISHANTYHIDTIYYCDMSDLRDKKYLNDDGEIETEIEASPAYYELLDNLGSYASTYYCLNDESVKRIYLPTLISVVNGEILYFHQGTISSQDDPYISLEEEQIKELEKTLTLGFVRYNARMADLKAIKSEDLKNQENDQ